MKNLLKSAVCVVALLLLVPVHAGTVRVSGTRLNFLADPGEVNNVTIDLVSGAYSIHDTGAAITPNPGNGFTVISANEVTISASGISGMDVVLGDQNDHAQVTSNVVIPTRFFGGEGDDTMLGGTGDDTFFWGSSFGGGYGNDTIDGGGGNDLLRVEEDADLTLSDTQLQSLGYVTTLAGLEAIDLAARPNAHRIDASAVTAGAGYNIRFFGSDGDDVILGGGGNDTFFWGNSFGGGYGNDTIDGGGGNDLLRVEEDADLTLSDTQLQSLGYVTTLAGLEAIDLAARPNAHRIDASAVTAGAGYNIRFLGSDGDDVMLGSGGNDTFFWGSGFGGMRGNDTIDGGGGYDLLRIEEDADLTLTDTQLQSLGYVTMLAGLEGIDLAARPNAHRIDASAVTGGAGYNIRFLGSDGDDVILGSGGNDTFFWGSGFGGMRGNDTIDGGGGYDLLRVEEDADMILSDTVLLAVGYAVNFAALENIDLAGGPGNNILDASAVTAASGLSLRLIGRAGDDVLIGGEGAVQFFGESGSDTVVASPASHIWHVTSANSGDLDGYPFQSVENLIGGTGNDLFIFADGASLSGRIDGNAGTDTVDWRQFSTSPNVVTTGAGTIDGFKGTASNIAAGFDNINELLGVGDNTPPTISCPANITVPCSVALLAPVTFSVTATDGSDPSPTVTCSPPSGSGFPIGTTTVQCTARDASGNEAVCSFTVTRAPLAFSGFLSPIGGADATGGDFSHPLRSFKLKSTIPVKFNVFCNGSAVLTGVHSLEAIHWSTVTNSDPPIDATPSDAATTGNQFRLVGSEWHFNLDTKATGMSVGIWQLIATLSDGSQHSVWIQIK
ncbi:MAG: HYR domain-containing protein [Verrucomicrobiota bacterium]